MHIQDGLLSPEVCAATGAIAVGAVGYSLYRMKDELADRSVPMTGMVSALIFAGQMVNFPLPGGTSGHLIGGVLAARLLGPWAGCVAVTLVLVVQRFLFADGGLMVLGANVFHMAVVGAIGGYAVQSLVSRFWRDPTGPAARVFASVIAAWVTVIAAAGLCCLEFAVTWHGVAEIQLVNFLALMLVFHALVGVGESLITGGVVQFVAVRRPDLLFGESAAEPTSMKRVLLQGVFATAAVVVFLAPFASGAPDALEASIERSSLAVPESAARALFDDYDQVLPLEGWPAVSVIVAGLLGTAVVLAIAIGLGRSIASVERQGSPKEA